MVRAATADRPVAKMAVAPPGTLLPPLCVEAGQPQLTSAGLAAAEGPLPVPLPDELAPVAVLFEGGAEGEVRWGAKRVRRLQRLLPGEDYPRLRRAEGPPLAAPGVSRRVEKFEVWSAGN